MLFSKKGGSVRPTGDESTRFEEMTTPQQLRHSGAFSRTSASARRAGRREEQEEDIATQNRSNASNTRKCVITSLSLCVAFCILGAITFLLMALLIQARVLPPSLMSCKDDGTCVLNTGGLGISQLTERSIRSSAPIRTTEVEVEAIQRRLNSEQVPRVSGAVLLVLSQAISGRSVAALEADVRDPSSGKLVGVASTTATTMAWNPSTSTTAFSTSIDLRFTDQSAGPFLARALGNGGHVGSLPLELVNLKLTEDSEEGEGGTASEDDGVFDDAYVLLEGRQLFPLEPLVKSLEVSEVSLKALNPAENDASIGAEVGSSVVVGLLSLTTKRKRLGLTPLSLQLEGDLTIKGVEGASVSLVGGHAPLWIGGRGDAEGSLKGKLTCPENTEESSLRCDGLSRLSGETLRRQLAAESVALSLQGSATMVLRSSNGMTIEVEGVGVNTEMEIGHGETVEKFGVVLKEMKSADRDELLLDVNIQGGPSSFSADKMGVFKRMFWGPLPLSVNSDRGDDHSSAGTFVVDDLRWSAEGGESSDLSSGKMKFDEGEKGSNQAANLAHTLSSILSQDEGEDDKGAGGLTASLSNSTAVVNTPIPWVKNAFRDLYFPVHLTISKEKEEEDGGNPTFVQLSLSSPRLDLSLPPNSPLSQPLLSATAEMTLSPPKALSSLGLSIQTAGFTMALMSDEKVALAAIALPQTPPLPLSPSESSAVSSKASAVSVSVPMRSSPLLLLKDGAPFVALLSEGGEEGSLTLRGTTSLALEGISERASPLTVADIGVSADLPLGPQGLRSVDFQMEDFKVERMDDMREDSAGSVEDVKRLISFSAFLKAPTRSLPLKLPRMAFDLYTPQLTEIQEGGLQGRIGWMETLSTVSFRSEKDKVDDVTPVHGLILLPSTDEGERIHETLVGISRGEEGEKTRDSLVFPFKASKQGGRCAGLRGGAALCPLWLTGLLESMEGTLNVTSAQSGRTIASVAALQDEEEEDPGEVTLSGVNVTGVTVQPLEASVSSAVGLEVQAEVVMGVSLRFPSGVEDPVVSSVRVEGIIGRGEKSEADWRSWSEVGSVNLTTSGTGVGVNVTAGRLATVLGGVVVSVGEGMPWPLEGPFSFSGNFTVSLAEGGEISTVFENIPVSGEWKKSSLEVTRMTDLRKRGEKPKKSEGLPFGVSVSLSQSVHVHSPLPLPEVTYSLRLGSFPREAIGTLSLRGVKVNPAEDDGGGSVSFASGRGRFLTISEGVSSRAVKRFITEMSSVGPEGMNLTAVLDMPIENSELTNDGILTSLFLPESLHIPYLPWTAKAALEAGEGEGGKKTLELRMNVTDLAIGEEEEETETEGEEETEASDEDDDLQVWLSASLALSLLRLPAALQEVVARWEAAELRIRFLQQEKSEDADEGTVIARLSTSGLTNMLTPELEVRANDDLRGVSLLLGLSPSDGEMELVDGADSLTSLGSLLLEQGEEGLPIVGEVLLRADTSLGTATLDPLEFEGRAVVQSSSSPSSSSVETPGREETRVTALVISDSTEEEWGTSEETVELSLGGELVNPFPVSFVLGRVSEGVSVSLRVENEDGGQLSLVGEGEGEEGTEAAAQSFFIIPPFSNQLIARGKLGRENEKVLSSLLSSLLKGSNAALTVFPSERTRPLASLLAEGLPNPLEWDERASRSGPVKPVVRAQSVSMDFGRNGNALATPQLSCDVGVEIESPPGADLSMRVASVTGGLRLLYEGSQAGTLGVELSNLQTSSDGLSFEGSLRNVDLSGPSDGLPSLVRESLWAGEGTRKDVDVSGAPSVTIQTKIGETRIDAFPLALQIPLEGAGGLMSDEMTTRSVEVDSTSSSGLSLGLSVRIFGRSPIPLRVGPLSLDVYDRQGTTSASSRVGTLRFQDFRLSNEGAVQLDANLEVTGSAAERTVSNLFALESQRLAVRGTTSSSPSPFLQRVFQGWQASLELPPAPFGFINAISIQLGSFLFMRPSATVVFENPLSAAIEVLSFNAEVRVPGSSSVIGTVKKSWPSSAPQRVPPRDISIASDLDLSLLLGPAAFITGFQTANSGRASVDVIGRANIWVGRYRMTLNFNQKGVDSTF